MKPVLNDACCACQSLESCRQVYSRFHPAPEGLRLLALVSHGQSIPHRLHPTFSVEIRSLVLTTMTALARGGSALSICRHRLGLTVRPMTTIGIHVNLMVGETGAERPATVTGPPGPIRAEVDEEKRMSAGEVQPGSVVAVTLREEGRRMIRRPSKQSLDTWHLAGGFLRRPEITWKR